MTDGELIDEILEILDLLVARVRKRVPGILAGSRYDGAWRDGGMQPSASFAVSASSDGLDLCVLLRRKEGALQCTADLVRAGSGDFLGEMDPVTVTNPTDEAGIKNLLDAVSTFASAQEDCVVREMRRGA